MIRRLVLIVAALVLHASLGARIDLCAGGPPTLDGNPVLSDSLKVPDSLNFGAAPLGSCPVRSDSVEAISSSGTLLVEFSLRRGAAFTLLGRTVDSLDGRIIRHVVFTIRFCPRQDTLCPRDTLVVRVRSISDTLDTGSVHLVPITGCAQQNTPVLEARPTMLDFGIPGPDSCVQRQVLLVNGSGRPLSVALSVGGTSPPFTIVSPSTPTVTIDSFVGVVVQYCPQTGDADGVSALLRVTLDTAGQSIPLVDVPLAGRTTPMRAPRDVDFGSVPLGLCRDTIILVENFRRRGITIFGIHVDRTAGSFSTTVTGAIQVAAFDTARIPVKFCPDSAGARLALLTVDTANGGQPMPIRLTGTGVNGTLSSARDTLHFPTVVVPPSGCSYDTVDVVNVGSTAIVLTSAQLTSTSFSFVDSVSLPDTVEPGEKLSVRLRFCADSSGTYAGELILGRGGSILVGVHLIGIANDTSNGGGSRTLEPIDSTVEFGDVLVGRGSIRTVVLVNRGTAPALLNGSQVVPSPPFRIVGMAGVGPVGPNDSIEIAIEFRPQAPGVSSGIWSGSVVGQNESIDVVLRGKGAIRRIWLDTVVARVGDEAEFTLRVTPPFDSQDTIRFVRAHMAFDPRSIVPLAARSATGTVFLSHQDDSTIIVDLIGQPSQFVTGGIPATVTFVGLSTGRPRTIIDVMADSLQGLGSPLIVDDGMVVLEGCDLGRDTRLGRRTRLNGLRVTHRDEVVIDYRAPMHAVVRLHIVNLAGTEISRIVLPEGDDTDRTHRVECAGIPPGIYILDLRAGSDRAGAIVCIP